MILYIPAAFFPTTLMAARQTMHTGIIDTSGAFTSAFIEWLSKQPNAVMLETSLRDSENQKSYIFLKPESIIKATSLEKIEGALTQAQDALNDGYYVAGFLTYEAGYAFENVLQQDIHSALPLVWFGVYKQPLLYHHKKKKFEEGKKQVARIVSALRESSSMPEVPRIDPKLSIRFHDYQKAIERIKEYILEGDTYQVNYTFKLKFALPDSPAALYQQLRLSQRVGYSAFISLKGYKILSISPELFFRIDGNRITLKPMKGTASRGRMLEEDRRRIEELRSSEKNRAENLMIVDMLRNDVGKIAQTGSVKVARFFDIERYDTLFQATSTIEAKLRSKVGVLDLMKSLFPSGSVTGAPKIRTMQIIRELEREPRGLYTGSVGFLAPKKKAVFSVAIRTVVLDLKKQRGEMGVGSGIVHDSDIESEYQECLLKAKFLTEPPTEFQLFETMRWEPRRGFLLLKEHLKRLERSAEYFAFHYERRRLISFLKDFERGLRKESGKKHSFRVRLTMGRDGKFSAAHFCLERTEGVQHVKLSGRRTNSSDRFLFHKTTNRRMYDEELERAVLKGYFDVLFLNEHGQLTEGARSNIFLKKGETLFTPPVSCGVLAGTYREHLLRSKKYDAEEKILTLDNLKTADEIYVCNAVRGLVKVQVDGLQDS